MDSSGAIRRIAFLFLQYSHAFILMVTNTAGTSLIAIVPLGVRSIDVRVETPRWISEVTAMARFTYLRFTHLIDGNKHLHKKKRRKEVHKRKKRVTIPNGYEDKI